MKKYKVISTISFVWEKYVEAEDKEDAIIKGEKLLEDEDIVEYFKNTNDFSVTGIDVIDTKDDE